MKKKISVLLALALTFSLGMTVSAMPQQEAQDVIGTYEKGEDGGVVYSVDVTWTAMEFTYNSEAKGTWNTTDLKYDDTADAFWEGTGTITVTNRSNAEITVTPSYTKADGYSEANVTFSTNSLTVDSADTAETAGEAGTEQTGTITVAPEGSLPAGTENVKIGTITVTIS